MKAASLCNFTININMWPRSLSGHRHLPEFYLVANYKRTNGDLFNFASPYYSCLNINLREVFNKILYMSFYNNMTNLFRIHAKHPSVF